MSGCREAAMRKRKRKTSHRQQSRARGNSGWPEGRADRQGDERRWHSQLPGLTEGTVNKADDGVRMKVPVSVCSIMCGLLLAAGGAARGSSKKTREKRQDGLEHTRTTKRRTTDDVLKKGGRPGGLMIDRCSRSAAVVGSQAQRRMHTTATTPRTLDFLGQ